MPRKIDPDQTHGEKVMRLFARLLFSSRPHSSSELADTSELLQTNGSRILEKIERSMGRSRKAEDRPRDHIRYQKPQAAAAEYLSQSEMDLLWMCRGFAERLVGKDLFNEVQQALFKSQTLVKGDATPAAEHFASFFSGTIDYTPHQDTIRTLIEGMNERHVCKVTYKAAASEQPKTFNIKPLKIFTHRDTSLPSCPESQRPVAKEVGGTRF